MSFNTIVTVYRYFFHLSIIYGSDYRPCNRLSGGEF